MFWAKGPVYLHLLNQVYPPVGLAAFTLGEDRRFTVQTLTTANGDPACAGASAYYTHGYSAGHSTTTEWEFYAFQVCPRPQGKGPPPAPRRPPAVDRPPPSLTMTIAGGYCAANRRRERPQPLSLSLPATTAVPKRGGGGHGR